MSLDGRLKEAFSASTRELDDPAVEQDLSLMLRQGRRSRRNRRIGALIAAVALVLGAVFVAPRALDAIRSLGNDRNRPAVPQEPRDRPGVISTVFGTGEHTSTGDGGPAANATLSYPGNLVMDDAGNIYVLELGRIRRIDASGRIITFAGRGAAQGPTAGTEASRLRFPSAHPTTALAIDDAGNLYVGGGDGSHSIVNRISPSGEVARVAGTGQAGFSGDGGPALQASLSWAYDLAVDPAGNVYISDGDDDRIRMVDTNGVITTIAGTGQPGWSGDGGLATNAQIEDPGGIALDGSGNLYFTQAPAVVRRVDAATGVITTIAGSDKVGYAGDGGSALEARLNAPEHVAIDAEGNVYIADTGNHCIRVVDLDGIITTIVGKPRAGFAGDGGPAKLARLYEPSGMLLTPDGVLYISDSGNNRIRKVTL